MKSCIIDCFLFNNEKELLLARISYLEKYVDFFCIVESEYSFTGRKKEFNARKVIEAAHGYKFLQTRVLILENSLYISENSIDYIKQRYSNSPILTELQKQYDDIQIDKFVWLNDCFQRELLSEAIDKCVKRNCLDRGSLSIMVSDVDEIPKIDFVLHNDASREAIFFAEMDQFRYNMDIIDRDKWIGTVKFGTKSLMQHSVNELRFATKRRVTNVKDYVIWHSAGWHFTSFGNIKEIKHKMDSWGHQELNTCINRYFIQFRLKYGLDVFGRNISYNVSNEKNMVPVELKNKLLKFSLQTTLEPLFYHKLAHRIIWFFDRLLYRILR